MLIHLLAGTALAMRARPPRPPRCEASCVMSAGPGVPIPFRTLSQQEIVDKLDAIPAFSIVAAGDQMVPTRGPDGGLSCCFYMDLEEAKGALAAVQTRNPGQALTLAATPLGTAFALSEWRSSPPSAAAERARPGVMDALRRSLREDEGGEVPTEPAAGGGPDTRLQASQSELEAVEDALAASPAPPLLQRRNRLLGHLPLFGSDNIRFRAEEADEAPAWMPLFLRREDVASAWLASGGDASSLPSLQVTDLRTLAWQMESDESHDWRNILLVAPDSSIEFVQQQQQQQDEEEERRQEEEDEEAVVPLSPADVQGVLFPDNSLRFRQ